MVCEYHHISQFSYRRLAHADFANQLTTKTPLRQLAMATTVPRNWAVRSTLQPPRVVTWATNTSLSARAKVMTPRHAPMRAMCRRRTIAKIQLQMGVIWHVLVKPLLAKFVLALTMCRFSSMRMSFPKMVFHKGCIARCTMRHGIRLTGQITDSTREMIDTLFHDRIATRLCKLMDCFWFDFPKLRAFFL